MSQYFASKYDFEAQWAREQDSLRNLVRKPIEREWKKLSKNSNQLNVKNMFSAGWTNFSAKAQKC